MLCDRVTEAQPDNHATNMNTNIVLDLHRCSV